MADILITGAGMVGVSTALALQNQGHNVVLVDKTLQCRETSYGNAGIIQAEAAEPYALPRDFMTLCKYALGLSNDVQWQSTALLQMAPALWQYFKASAPSRHRATSQVYAQLTGRATQDHAPWISAAQADALITQSGLSMLYRDERAFDQAITQAQRIIQTYAIQAEILDGKRYCQQEPALKKAPAGVIHWQQSWSCSNPGALTDAYAQLFIQRGGYRQIGDASSLVQTNHGWTISGQDGTLNAEHAVIALGPWSPALLAGFGYTIPMIYKRGYHTHFAAKTPPLRPFLDAANGVVVAPMQQGVRVTSGAALVRMQSAAAPIQLQRGIDALSDLIDLGPAVEQEAWFGTRPCMPDMLPLVGAAPRHKGLWFNFGHGHQGFTLGPTTAALLTECIEGKPSELAQRLAPSQRL